MTGQEWWDSIKDDDNKIIEWLKMQYHGESSAAMRLAILWEKLEGRTQRYDDIVDLIIQQEIKHAKWIYKLLSNRGESPFSLGSRKDSYWEREFDEIKTVHDLALMGAEAEEFEQEKIEVLLKYDKTPDDIREVFDNILGEEKFHAKIFRQMAEETKG